MQQLIYRSFMRADYIPSWTATVVEELEREGVIFVGKTNMDEFGMGSHSQNGYFGPVKNPLNELNSPGGSSGGSAAAVAGGLVDAALGSDTGGSIRLPAAYCGIVGFKPTYGRISRNGLVSFASSLDTIGFMAQNVEMIKGLFEVAKRTGKVADMTSHKRSGDYTNSNNARKFKVRIVDELQNYMDAESRQIFNDFILLLKSSGDIKLEKQISVPSLNYSLMSYYVCSTIEASSCLARYPSIHFKSDKNASFGLNTMNRIALGKWLPLEIYNKAADKRNQIRLELEKVLISENEDVKLIICPTSPRRAPLLSDLSIEHSDSVWSIERWKHLLSSDLLNTNIIDLFKDDIFTIPASLAGLPAISIPFHDIGIQIIAMRDEDEELLEFVHLIESFLLKNEK